MNDYKINILHLYPDLLNLYGDKGNIECLKKRLLWRGIDVEVIECTRDDSEIDFDNADIIFLGGGSDKEQEIVRERLLDSKSEFINFANNGGTILAFCGGYELLADEIKTSEKTVNGLGVLDICVDLTMSEKRFIGNIVIESENINGKIVGFENHGGRVDIKQHKPFGKVLNGFGNDGQSGYEGVVYNNVIATYMHGPLLPKNPHLCDRILTNALKHKYNDFDSLSELDDTIENLANEYISRKYGNTTRK